MIFMPNLRIFHIQMRPALIHGGKKIKQKTRRNPCPSTALSWCCPCKSTQNPPDPVACSKLVFCPRPQGSKSPSAKPETVDINSVRSLAQMGVDVSFLDTFGEYQFLVRPSKVICCRIQFYAGGFPGNVFYCLCHVSSIRALTFASCLIFSLTIVSFLTLKGIFVLFPMFPSCLTSTAWTPSFSS